MSQTLRHPEILDLARRDGTVTVDGLARHFDVTLQTIRRDLRDLTRAGKLERVHGGAILPSGTRNIGYDHRQAMNAGAKARIARACAARIPNDCAVFLNIGTTTEAVARALLHHTGLMAFTNNLNVANILAANPDCEVIVTGGTLRRADGGLVGTLAAASIARFKFDHAVIGCSALDRDGDLRDFDILEVGVSQSIITRADHVHLVADQSKFARKAPACIASVATVGTFFTDRPPPPDFQQHCEGWDTEIVIAD
ncbi:MAG: DeoR family transcriptional regulator [Rhodobacterales bacterium]|nr:MAG: DeoR family transcriptional regulator [Rhodobacterales bacterium]